MYAYLILAWRNIWRNRRRTLITVSAIVFAVVVSVFMQSLNRGSHEMMLDNVLRFDTGYLQLRDYRYEEEPSLDNTFAYDESIRKRVAGADENIKLCLPRIETFMLAADDESTRGAIVMGIVPEKEHQLNGIRDRMVQGRMFKNEEPDVAVLSQGLADRLQLGVGDTLVLIGQGRFAMSASGLFKIAGIVDHPLRQMNRQTVYLPLPEAQRLLSAEGYISKLLIVPRFERHTSQIAVSLRHEFDQEVDELVVYTWPEMIPELIELFEFDLAVPRFLTVVLYVVIGFGFFGTILTMTMERLKEFGVLLSVGMRRHRLAMVVFIETLLIGFVGTGIGLVMAWLIVFYFHMKPIALTGDAAQAVKDMGWDPVLPVSFAADQFYTQGIFIFVIAMVIYLFPLLKIFRLNIIEAARK